MGNAREIKTKIKSIQNTRKVTKALEMVSASKIRRAQDLMKSSRPYAQAMRQMIGHVAEANSDYEHPFMVSREEIKRVGYIIVSSDRGLCGGLNSNLFRKMLTEISEWQEKGVEVDIVAIGQKAQMFFKRIKVNMVASVTHLGENPKLEQVIGVVNAMIQAYQDGEIDQVQLCHNLFVNTMVQKATSDTLLPLPADSEGTMTHDWDYIYEPSAEQVLDEVMTRYLEALVYQAVLENLASEHASRMVAMKSASDNANKLIDELELKYNKARQAAITQEISEIVGGAAAV